MESASGNRPFWAARNEGGWTVSHDVKSFGFQGGSKNEAIDERERWKNIVVSALGSRDRGGHRISYYLKTRKYKGSRGQWNMGIEEIKKSI